ncbi:TonB-dependent receptor [Stakelama sediminis]|uniref:TonB-dependent receptor n=1 Tax=Stakelama sediminis TaxID=463200 RepID=A0A840YU83_9SPHN|nr:TonB-dependent receptor [Stakelama sediminis]
MVALGASLGISPVYAKPLQQQEAGAQSSQSGKAKGKRKQTSTVGTTQQAGTSGQAAADQAAASVPQSGDIVVTGFLESLRSAQSIKKNSAVIVDSITAEDIGALPDRSVTEALQRIPGVSINRFAAGVDPDHFSVEGSGVTIRGLTYTRSEINGNDAFSAGNGSGINFQDIPSELLAGVDVFKTPTASMIEGGIGGTVNLRTRLPFDQKKALLAGSLQMNYGDFAKKGSPVVSMLASNRWDTPIGEIGILGSFSYSQLYSRADRLGISSFRPRTVYSDGTRNDVIPFDGATEVGSILFPRGAVVGSQNFDRQRYGFSGALQWRSNDGSMEATFRFLRSDARQAWNENTIEIATDNVAANSDANGVPDSRARAGTSINYDDSGMFESGYITGPTGWRADQNSGNARTPAEGLQSNNIARQHTERNVVNDYTANFRWDMTDRLSMKLDYQHVDSFAQAMDNGLWISSYQDAYIKLNGNSLPDVQFLPPQNCESANFNTATNSCMGTPGTANYPSYYTGSHQSFLDPYNSFYRSAMDHYEYSDGNEDSIRADFNYRFPDNGFLKSVQVGGRYADRDQTARYSVYNWGRLSEQWGNNGPVWLDDPVNGAQLNGYVPNLFGDYFKGQAAFPGSPGRLYYSGNPATDYQDYINYATAINRQWEPTTTCSDGRVINGGWNPIISRCGNLPNSPFQPGEVNPQHWRNWATYVMANIDSTFSNGWELTGNVGVRYTNTRRSSFGYQQFANNANSLPTEAQCNEPIDPGQQASPFCTFSPEVRAQARAFLNGALNGNDKIVNYDYWLPSANFKLAVTDKLQFRLGYFKGVYAPQFGYTRNYFNITGLSTVANYDSSGNAIPNSYSIQTTTTAGNPLLLPTKSDNYDFTVGWYFSNVGHLTGALFYKRLTDVVTNSTQRIDLTNNGATFPAVVTQPVNSPDVGHVKGFELSYSQVYSFLPGFLKGLGLQATYTYVDSSGVPQSTLSATDPDVAAGRTSSITGTDFPLQGLSKHTINVTPFINIGPLELRAAYNWRSRYLLTIRDVITPFDPIFQEAYGQLDASATFTVTPHFKIGVQAVNLTNSITKTQAAVLDSAGKIQYVPRQWYTADSRFTILTRFTF